jgi:hypothetical protein
VMLPRCSPLVCKYVFPLTWVLETVARRGLGAGLHMYGSNTGMDVSGLQSRLCKPSEQMNLQHAMTYLTATATHCSQCTADDATCCRSGNMWPACQHRMMLPCSYLTKGW